MIITLGKFNSINLAKSYANRTVKPSTVVMGDDEKYWVVNLSNFEKAVKAGYEQI